MLTKGLTDQLVLDIDENPPYAVVNDERYDKYILSNSIPMIYAFQSHNKETKSSDIHNCFIQTITNHKIKLLKSETYARSEILKGKRDSETLAKDLTSYVMTDFLCEEVMNLEYKQAGNETKIVQISKAINKDKFSALEYALYWIYMEEQKNKVKSEEANWEDYIYFGGGLF